jgi:hypothetical protein
MARRQSPDTRYDDVGIDAMVTVWITSSAGLRERQRQIEYT